MLNLFPNHLDYHSTIENYFQAKAHILRIREGMILLSSIFSLSDWSTRFSRLVKSQLVPVARDKNSPRILYFERSFSR